MSAAAANPPGASPVTGSSFTYAYARPALAVDCVVFGFSAEALSVLLIERDEKPHGWALPGGFVRISEALEEAARRELAEETGLRGMYLEQLYTFGEPKRDPRERVVSVAYYALVKNAGVKPIAGTDARRAAWFSVDKLPKLAFDHASIIETATDRLRGKVRYQPIGFELLPELFTLAELQQLYEVLLGRQLDKRNFRKKVAAMKLLSRTPHQQEGVAHRAARLYRFDSARYETLKKRGFLFEL